MLLLAGWHLCIEGWGGGGGGRVDNLMLQLTFMKTITMSRIKIEHTSLVMKVGISANLLEKQHFQKWSNFIY